jgi:trehalose 6-phosphate synthase/phosphatase
VNNINKEIVMSRRLFIVSNRLPFYVAEERGRKVLVPSHGGLISAISSYIEIIKGESEIIWAGAPGCDKSEWTQIQKQVKAFNAHILPVLLPKREYEGYYNGFSNSTLWPVFHSLISYTVKSFSGYRAYLRVNEMFCEALLEVVTDQDQLWIHDYHLIPLISLLKKERPSLQISFFLHTPFPPLRIFGSLHSEWQRMILESLTQADKIGFQTQEDRKNFLEALKIARIEFEESITGVFPASIDFDKFNRCLDDSLIVELKNQWRSRFEKQKIIFSVDRLDYTKGLYHRLKAYQYFLESNPEYVGSVVFTMVVFPTLRKNTLYQEESKALIESSIKQINLRWGNIDWQPVIYIHRNLTKEELLSFYVSADIALITPLKDGMNLVAKEFVASRKDLRGVLILSKNAGAVCEMEDALITDPYNFKEVAYTIKAGLAMDESEQEWRMTRMQQKLRGYSVKNWGDSMLGIKNNRGVASG